ncbi:MAG: glycosyltransferase [Eubacterium sp.]|nr:glycosyltransferase [Eubacterium sp.]
MSEKKVSVVIPMYNAKQYIFHCIEGLKKQTLQDLEIIVVDDCSTDGSYDLCAEKYAGDERVKILRQPQNGGPGAARNAGIQSATGEYITFVDCDDAVTTDAFSAMVRVAEEYDADVVHVGGALIPFAKELPDDLLSLNAEQRIRFILDGEDLVDDASDGAEKVRVLSGDICQRMDEWLRHFHHWNIWSKLYRREFLLEHRIGFVDLSLAEDQNFAFHCLLHAKNYVKMPGFFYLYRIAAESLSRGKKNTNFMAKLLRTAFDLSACMDKTMDTHSFFSDNSDYRERVKAFCLMFLENGYIRDCYQTVGRSALETDETIQGIFREHFGSNAGYIAKQFYDAHDAMPLPEGQAPDMNSYEFWEKMVERFGAGQVIRLGRQS